MIGQTQHAIALKHLGATSDSMEQLVLFSVVAWGCLRVLGGPLVLRDRRRLL